MKKPKCVCGKEFTMPFTDQMDALQFAFDWDEKEYAAIDKLWRDAFCRGWSECESARADIKTDKN